MNYNPFKQFAKIWEVTIIISDEQYLRQITDIFELFEINFSVFVKEIDNIPVEWTYSGYFNSEQDLANFKAAIETFNGKNNQDLMIEAKILDDKDWVMDVITNSTPINAGKFLIHTSNYRNHPSGKNKINIEIDHGRAFGTGEHETTKLCLEAISNLSTSFYNILDLGSGSGILAIAASKIFQASKIVASDIDFVSTEVAENNAKKNNVQNISFLTSDGFNHNDLDIKFDLIIANILANPLISLCSDIADHLKQEGIVILSGFIEEDSSRIINSYQEYSFHLQKKYSDKNWVCLVLQKNI